jgi:tRNA(fMet)-specific endonuclease VapC
MERMHPADVLVCSIVKAELYYGANRSYRKPQTLAALEEFLNLFTSLPFDDSAARVYGKIRAELSSKGIPIGPNDLMIASIALANEVTLVTHNSREFGRVDALLIEDWQG